MKKKFALLAMTTLLASSLAACSNNAAPSASSESASQPAVQPSATASASASAETPKDDYTTKYENPITITIGRPGISGNNLPEGDTLENNEYLKYIENKTNVKIKYDFSVEDAAAYAQKVNLAIASSSIPDMMIVSEEQFKRLAQADMLEDLTDLFDPYLSPLIKDYYASFGDRVLNPVKVNGRLMALPDTNIDGNFQLLWVRKDWLDKLSLPIPSTVDELAATAKAFVENDPDGNGKPDSFGLLGDSTLYGDGGFFTFDPIFNAYHSYPKSWIKDASGNAVYGSIQPETKEALAKLRDMYANGLIDKEFLTRKAFEDNAGFVAGGRNGLVIAPWFAGWMLSDSVKTDTKADWIPVSMPVDADGKRNVVMSSPSTNYLVVKKGIEHPEAVLKVLSVQYQGLRFLDPEAANIYKDKGVSWLNWPIPVGLNYFDSVPRDAEAYQKALDSKDAGALDASQKERFASIEKDNANPKADIPAFANKLAFFVGGAALQSDKINRIEPAFFGTTETLLKRGANLTKIENETFLKIITGQAPIDEFDKFVEQWKSIGGDQVTQEVNAAVSGK